MWQKTWQVMEDSNWQNTHRAMRLIEFPLVFGVECVLLVCLVVVPYDATLRVHDTLIAFRSDRVRACYT